MSIVEVSRLAGVSPATVSRVLNNHPHVSDRTAIRIRKAMRQLKYQPRPYGTLRRTDESARPEMNRKLAVFALILPEVRSGFYPTLIESFASEAESLNHQVMTCCTHNDVGRQANAILQLLDHQVAGVALVPATVGPSPAHHVRQLQRHNIATVLLHRAVSGVTAPLVWLDHEHVGRKAAHLLLEAGHERVAYFGTHMTQNPNPYLNGFRAVLREAGHDLEDTLIHYGLAPRTPDDPASPERRAAAKEAAVEASLRRMLALSPSLRPTAIFCSFDPYAEVVYLVMQRLGVRVPKEMSLLSVGSMARQDGIAHHLTSITVNAEWAGSTAAQMLNEMVQGWQPLESEKCVSIPVGVHIGATIAPRKSD